MARAESVMTKRTFIRLRRRPPCLTSPPTRKAALVPRLAGLDLAGRDEEGVASR
jgi:hypothetical protein